MQKNEIENVEIYMISPKTFFRGRLKKGEIFRAKELKIILSDNYFNPKTEIDYVKLINLIDSDIESVVPDRLFIDCRIAVVIEIINRKKIEIFSTWNCDSIIIDDKKIMNKNFKKLFEKFIYKFKLII